MPQLSGSAVRRQVVILRKKAGRIAQDEYSRDDIDRCDA